ncbi:hypothetical protein GQ53DRAFT_782384 [Thozetella sp. PMI_491]|nr:hypothetical protein GQ53DRAFT_782384 [Thozetella sp. PMI_491]
MGSLSPHQRDELRIITPIGMLGQGFSEKILWNAVENLGMDAMIMDSGSTDSGPGRLATGTLSLPRSGFERDLAAMLRVTHLRRIPILIGSAGGDGENQFVDLLIGIVEKLIWENGYRTMKKLADGLISPCGGGVPELTGHEISIATRIVAQMGQEPYIKAMEENPDFDVIIGGRVYDPVPYAAYCMYKGFKNQGMCLTLFSCGGQCSIPKSREALAIVTDEYVDVMALDPKSQMTSVSVASHFLYEKSRPDILQGPGVTLHLASATYEQIAYNHVRVRGPKWEVESAEEYTLKIEGARTAGYYTAVIGAFRNPILISQLDYLLNTLEVMVKEKMCNVEFGLKIHRYGIDGVMGRLEPDKSLPKEVCVVLQARAATQQLANQSASGCKFGFCHIPYPGQLATAGNFAWPFTPCEMPSGPLAEFDVYHIMHKCDPVALCPIRAITVQGTNTYLQEALTLPKLEQTQPVCAKEEPRMKAPRIYYLQAEPEPGTCYLADVTSVVRSKNSGPYELTLDVMFGDNDTYEAFKSSNLLNKATIAKLYSIPEKEVLVSMYWDQAMAYKATIVRPLISGGFAETDTHGSQQHAPLLYLKVPLPRYTRA